MWRSRCDSRVTTRTAGTPPASSLIVSVPAGGFGIKRSADRRHCRISATVAPGRSRRLRNKRTPRRTSSARKLMNSLADAADRGRSPASRRSKSYGRAVQIVRVGALDAGRDDLTHPQRSPAGEEDAPVDFRSVGVAAPLRDRGPDLVDDDLLTRTDLPLQAFGRDGLLMPHQSVPTLLLGLVRDWRGEPVGACAVHRFVAEAAHPVELGFAQPVEQQREILFRL